MEKYIRTLDMKEFVFELAHVWDIACRPILFARAENNCIQRNQHYVLKKLIAGRI